MDIKVTDIKMPKKDYIEVKKIAYVYYEEYKTLTKKEQSIFLDNIKTLDTPVKTMILKNTLIFPDTEKLLSMPQGQIHGYLKNLKESENEVDDSIVFFKQMEYSIMNTPKLVSDGLLLCMDDKKYLEEDIGIKKYSELKLEALKHRKDFAELSLVEQKKFIDGCTDSWTYEDKIQLSTLLLPNDSALMKEMEKMSLEVLATKYRLPISLLEFKKQEYELQETQKLIETKILEQKFKNIPLGYDVFDGSIAYTIWDQNFYNNIKQGHIDEINNKLSKMYETKEVKRK